MPFDATLLMLLVPSVTDGTLAELLLAALALLGSLLYGAIASAVTVILARLGAWLRRGRRPDDAPERRDTPRDRDDREAPRAAWMLLGVAAAHHAPTWVDAAWTLLLR